VSDDDKYRVNVPLFGVPQDIDEWISDQYLLFQQERLTPEQFTAAFQYATVLTLVLIAEELNEIEQEIAGK
jgi:hypothetical protein